MAVRCIIVCYFHTRWLSWTPTGFSGSVLARACRQCPPCESASCGSLLSSDDVWKVGSTRGPICESRDGGAGRHLSWRDPELPQSHLERTPPKTDYVRLWALQQWLFKLRVLFVVLLPSTPENKKLTLNDCCFGHRVGSCHCHQFVGDRETRWAYSTFSLSFLY